MYDPGKRNVLFLCTGNSVRSQMAEAFLRTYAGDLFVPYSAGLQPKGMNPYTLRVMNEIGISMEGQTSKGIKDYLGKTLFAYLITVCADAEQNCPTVWPGVRYRLHWTFNDPAAFEGSDEKKPGEFRRVRDQIDAKITEWVAEIRKQEDAISL